jgi:acyl-CoA synthetase (AMP-forming)/AMP-acid ligase II
MQPPSDTLSDALCAAAERWPDKPFLRDGSTVVTFSQLQEGSDRVACGLLNRGIRPLDRIAIATPNCVEWAYMFFAAAKLALPVVAVSTRYREQELAHMLNKAQVRLVLTSIESDGFDFVSFYDGFRASVPSLEHVVFQGGAGFDGSVAFTELAAAEVDREALAEAAEQVKPDSPALIAFTSGTTGEPKGATLTSRNLLTTVGAMVELLRLDQETFVGSLPVSHVGGIICGPLAALLSGSELVLMAAFTPKGALEIIDRNRANVFFGAPTMYSLMLDRADGYDITSLRHVIIGTSNAPPALCRRIAAALPSARLTNCYGLTEASGFALATGADDGLDIVARTIGKPMPHVDARVVNSEGQPVQDGEAGELQLRGDGICNGYWDAPEQTAATFLPGGWLATGDAVSREPDGHLVLRGRIKEMFIRGGFNIYPVEVENLLNTHPCVASVAGIGVPDPVLGEIGRYYVVPKPGATMEPDELQQFCRDKIADYKVPDQVVLVAALPLTAIGKIDKRALKLRGEAEVTA